MKTNDFKLNVLFVFGRHFGCPYLVILRGRIDLNLKPRLFAFLPKAVVISKGYYACSTILQFLEFSSKTVILCRWKKNYRVFSLTWPASMQIYWNKRKRLHKKRAQLPQDWFGTPTWPPFHWVWTPIWPP